MHICGSSLVGGLRGRLGLYFSVLITLATLFTTQCLGQCTFPQSSVANRLTYAFSPSVTDGKLVIHVTMGFRGGHDGQAELEFPSDWAGQSHLEAQMTNVKPLSTDTTILDTARPNIKTVRFPANSPVTVSYDLAKDWSGPFEYPKQFRAVLEPEFFEFNTQNALVHPRLSLTEVVSVHFDWTGLPAGWNLATSFGTDDRCQSFTGLWHKVNDALFAGGDFRLHRVTVAGQPLVVAIRGKWSFSDEDGVDRIQKIITAERNFWRDNNFPYYIVTLSPFDTQSGSSDGSAFTNAFWLFLSRNSDFSYGIQNLLAHESFHAWNPHKMGPIREPGEDVHWFTEGFTVYYSDLMLIRAGLLSLPEYIDRLNRRIQDYEASPVKNLSNNEIVTRYHLDNSVNQLPYIRGPVIALWLDAQIRRKSKNKSSLDTVMHKLLRDASSAPLRQLTTQRIFRTADKSLSREARKALRDLVQMGGAIAVPEFPLSACGHLTVDQIPPFDLGFNGEVLRVTSQVSGVNPGSEAYKAGVRDGQKAYGMSIYWGDVSKPVRLKVRSGGEEKTIEYFPRGNPIPVPQYHLDKEAWSSTPEACAFPVN